MKNLNDYIKESLLLEYEMGGNDFGKTFSEYERTHEIDPDLRNIFVDLHTIGQYYESIYKASEGETDKFTNGLNEKTASELVNILEPIVGLLSNKTFDKKDSHRIEMKDITDLKDTFISLSKLGKGCHAVEQLKISAERILNSLK